MKKFILAAVSGMAAWAGPSAGQFLDLAPGEQTLYIGTGARQSAALTTVVHCSIYKPETAPPSVYPVIVKVQHYSTEANTAATSNYSLVFNGTDETRTGSSDDAGTAAYAEDALPTADALLQQGTVRIIAPKKHAASILCSAEVVSILGTDPAVMRPISFERVGPRFKRPKDVIP